MSIKPKIPQEDIDLGTLFSQIGKMFSSFFNFFGNIFKAIYHYFIVLLLFIRKNILILGVATILGIVLGYVLDLNKQPTYKSELSVKTNYGSASLLYKKMDMLNTLLNKGDFDKIAELLYLTPEKASKLVSFVVEPIEQEKNTKQMYDRYMRVTDTTYTKEFAFEDFVQRVSITDLKHHKITIKTKEALDLNLSKGIEGLLETKYYLKLQKERVESHKEEMLLYTKTFSQVDSIRKRYKEIAYLEARKNKGCSSDLNLSSTNSVTRNFDTELIHYQFMTLDRLNNYKYRVFDDEAIISVTIPTIKSGEARGFLNKMWVRLGLLGFILSFLALMSIQFNKYLNKYEENVW